MNRTLRWAMLAGAVAFAGAASLAQSPAGAAHAPVFAGYVGHAPGALETLLGTGHASTARKVVGRLGGQNGVQATFTAISAWDPATPGSRIGGLEVKLEDHERSVAVYFDNSENAQPEWTALPYLQQCLVILEHRPGQESAGAPVELARSRDGLASGFETSPGWGGGAQERQLDVATATRGGLAGLTMRAWPSRLHPAPVGVSVGPFYFAGAGPEDVLRMVQDARRFLDGPWFGGPQPHPAGE